MNRYFRLFLHNLDTVLIILLSIVAAIYGVFGGSPEIMLSAIAGAVGLLAYSIFRDREARQGLAEEVTQINQILRTFRDRVSADEFFRTETSDSEAIRQARETVWLVQETGSKLIEDNFKALERLIYGGGSIRMILAAPGGQITDLLAFRNRNLRPSDIVQRHANAMHQLESLVQITKTYKGSVEVRTIRYPLDATYILVDSEVPETSRRNGLVRLVGFRDFFADKRDFLISTEREPITYQYYVSQFKSMWDVSESIPGFPQTPPPTSNTSNIPQSPG